jgi:cell division protein FtsI/penicillin-binding protein 2
VLGFAGVDNRGLEGVELQFDKYLYRKPKFVTLLKDAKNSLIYRETLPHLYAYNVVLTMDEMLQYIAEKRLKEWCKRFSAKSGCVILMDPYTAQILAMAVYPEFDPNHFFQHSPSQWRNRAITDLFEPGSIFKIITMAVALKEGIDPYKKQFFCNGFMEVEGRRIKCHQKHGAISVEDAIKYSCNCGVIQMVAHINDEKFYKHIKEFGFGQFTGIQLPGEVRGILKHPRSWTKTSKSSISIGYEISCTPLQMLCALLPFANGGYLLRPLIVKKIVDEKGRCIKEFSPTVIRRALEEKIVEDARRILEKVVEEGTGKGASLLFCAVAGKTGTAKKVEDGEYKEKFIASFVGFFPSKEAKVAMLALINEPKRLYWGGKVAAPLFKKIAEDVSLYLRIKQPLQIAKDANKVSLLH